VEGLNLTDQEVELKVVNGAGTQVFSTSNRQGQTWTDWDGKNSRGFDLPEGTYYYLLKVTSRDGQVFKKSGFIVLKRY
jgi:flagellar hook assembly protein FlgD